MYTATLDIEKIDSVSPVIQMSPESEDLERPEQDLGGLDQIKMRRPMAKSSDLSSDTQYLNGLLNKVAVN